jgi:uncharacterized protein YrrD
MKQLVPPARARWRAYLDLDVYTTDNQCFGRVIDVVCDSRSGEVILRVQEGSVFGRTINLPESAVGVVTRSKLMLDVSSDKIPTLQSPRSTRRPAELSHSHARSAPSRFW